MARRKIIVSLLLLSIGILCSCRTDRQNCASSLLSDGIVSSVVTNALAGKSKLPSSGGFDEFKPLSYMVRAGGPHSYVSLSKPPSSTPVSISFVKSTDDGLAFRLLNGEAHAILLWNVRVQIRSEGLGTDGFGWDTIYDDSPDGDKAEFRTGESGIFRVKKSRVTPWRICILYSTDWTDTGTFWGNCEVISEEFGEELLNFLSE